MRPIPVDFNIGPLTIHTYGIGLAITFYFAYRYYDRRLRNNGYNVEWLQKSFLWIIAAAILGARVVHVVANITYYLHNPGEIVLIWHGGLSSYGGLAFAIPAAMYFKHRHAPELSYAKGFDLIAPVLVAAWAMGRLLGPQLMINGGGRPTNAWYGLQYAGQIGYRIPVPLFQATEDFIIFLILLKLEKYFKEHHSPDGALIGSAALLWNIPRFSDEYLWLAVPRLWDAVEVFSLAVVAVSAIYLIILFNKSQHKTTATAETEPSAI
ncbi:MAG: hypothetical protein HKL84_04840 [Acidimicrobiaceae bacterium]|nr:hypothetical protein [Acidimicrobiaceae bacterium]